MKEKCINHPKEEALSFCHACGKYFCKFCLVEGAEFYYCCDEKCQAAKNENEGLISKRIEEERVTELSVDSGKRTFFKDAFFYLCMAFPIYFLSCLLIADVRLKSFGFLSLILSLIALATCVQVFIVIYTVFSIFKIKSFMLNDRKKAFRNISAAMSGISLFVFYIIMEKIKGDDLTENTSFVLSFIASMTIYFLSNFFLSPKVKGQKAKPSDLDSPGR